MSPTPDPLDAFCESLLSPAAAPAPAALREDLRARTTRLLRRRRRLKRLAWAAALAACYATGLLTMRLLPRPTPAAPHRPEVVQQPAPQTPAPPPDHAGPEVPATLLERQARAETPRRPELYRRAADRYLADDRDFSSALRCYGEALDAGANADRAIDPNDSWLLMAIKDAREKERRDVKKGS
jgi:hypothetical protein